MRIVRIALLAVCLVLASAPIDAHHAFSPEFDINQPVTLRGTLTRLDWINPHSWIFIEVKGADGQIEMWEVETTAPTGLMRRGLRKTDFPAGIELVVTGFKARKKPFTAAARTVKKTDGTEYFVGSGEAPEAPK